jgi:hypothetical protein
LGIEGRICIIIIIGRSCLLIWEVWQIAIRCISIIVILAVLAFEVGLFSLNTIQMVTGAPFRGAGNLGDISDSELLEACRVVEVVCEGHSPAANGMICTSTMEADQRPMAALFEQVPTYETHARFAEPTAFEQSELSVAQLTAAAILDLVQQAPSGSIGQQGRLTIPPLRRASDLLTFCHQWALAASREGGSAVMRPRASGGEQWWTIRMQALGGQCFAWVRGCICDRVATLVFYELCVEEAESGGAVVIEVIRQGDRTETVVRLADEIFVGIDFASDCSTDSGRFAVHKVLQLEALEMKEVW